MKQLTGVVMALLLVPCMVAADIPDIMSYQGVLRDGSSNPVPDGSYEVTFRIYDVETGGTALWTETQILTVTGGIINAHLGSSVSLGSLDWTIPYWLGVAVGGSEMVPRTAFTTVPYAGHAGSANRVLEGDDDWEIDDGDIYRYTGNVGIGTATPNVRLDVLEADAPAARFENNSDANRFTVRVVNSGGTAGAFFSESGPSSWPIDPAAVFGVGGAAARGGHFNSDGSDALFAASPNGKAIWGHSTGNYSGYFSGGGWGVYVDDLLNTRYFKMGTGAAAGYVLTSDATGNATWQPGSGSDGDWTISGSDIYSTVSGNVGIGTSMPDAKLRVYTSAPVETFEATHGFWTGGRVANIEWMDTPNPGNDVLQLKVPSTAPDDTQFLECERGTAIEFAVDGDGSVISSGRLEVIGDAEVQAAIVSDYASHTAKVVSATTVASGMYDVVGVFGQSITNDYYGIGGSFVGGYHGVEGQVFPSGSDYYSGVFGTVSGGSGQNYGVNGTAYSGNIGYGVYGYASDNAVNYAGYFQGDVNITGTLYGGVPAFRIDHPLDPEGKYLVHPSVQSDEMVNVYSGNVTLDGRGEATVEMPDWFEALNRDFRYQLTCIGGFAPVYIAETVSGGRFTIAGGEPGMTVSWQVTGVRADAVAVAHPVALEQEKTPYERGKYMHPEAFGRPLTQAVHYSEERETTHELSASGQIARLARDRHEDE